ncbi:PstA phosphate ABC transporter, permease protein [Pyrococcus sp. NA2]|uniref:phosphate ABC transporter permease PstA n=1 Tax=Pyrococcus sp. (strain NA2) TaxID=342949 RepID=UPI000209AFB7|nr:phosphate ABC transporter permease PstA [Pyrococcus sp. NA2]AEC51152.1 PstA phosphate ABC transporter, permease protein [Pyrococcus sp. NA2]
MEFIRKLKDIVFLFSIMAFTALSIFILLHVIFTITMKGLKPLISSGLRFVVGTLSEGGIGPAILGTLMLVLITALISIPIAFAIGVYMYEYREDKLAKILRGLLQLMLEFPTILTGIFVMQVLVVPMGHYSAIAGAFALSIIMIPYVAIYTAEALRQVPLTYKEAGYSLGFTQSQVLFRILVPIARKGIVTGILIGLAKIAGETAPLMFTIGGMYEGYSLNPLEPVGAVPLLIYTLIQSPSRYHQDIAWGAALVLLIIFLSIFLPLRLKIREVRL